MFAVSSALTTQSDHGDLIVCYVRITRHVRDDYRHGSDFQVLKDASPTRSDTMMLSVALPSTVAELRLL
jgi:hypothetical protein